MTVVKRLEVMAVVLVLLVFPVGREGHAAEWLDWVVYRIGAELGMSDAQYQLGLLFEKQSGLSANRQALSWYRAAADQGHSEAQVRLGILLEKGKGVAPNLVESYVFYNIAALKGDKAAEENRDALARRMTLEQIERAQKITRERMKLDAGQDR
ncbi:MAG: sel1 repeat family protein [Magnetococcales bacterium]|nr:sel1 repeat family protein [Magnetococcales bacterium]NGZ05527.1 sel1 repeat family protein [Magnetococcales bacterium]